METIDTSFLTNAAPGADGKNGKGKEATNIDLLMDVSLRVTVELLDLQHGSVVELDRLAGDPVDIYINERLIARGEVVVVDDKFGVRITELVSAERKGGA